MICSDKTGTLTTNNMTVIKFLADKKILDVEQTNLFASYPLYFAKLKEAICINSNARIQDEKGFGSTTELALIKMLINFGHSDYL